MIDTKFKLLLMFAIFLAMTGCTNIPKSEVPESKFSTLDCVAIADQLAQEQTTQERAAKAKGDSWKVVIPFAVAARYIDATSHINESERRVIALEQVQKSMGCNRLLSK